MIDLDETLIHFVYKKKKSKFLIRPFVYDFINQLAAYYELIIFTAAEKTYADWIIDKIDCQN